MYENVTGVSGGGILLNFKSTNLDKLFRYRSEFYDYIHKISIERYGANNIGELGD